MTISVLINNYNNGPWLRACVDSVLGQSRPAGEVIVYDDGSTDDSLAILRSYGAQIRLIEGIHDGTRPGIVSQAAAVAQSFAQSRGDHLYLLDGDDEFLPGKIAAYEAAWAARPGTLLVQSPMRLVTESGTIIRDNYEKSKHREDYLAATYRLQDVDFYYPMSSLAFHRSYLARRLPLDYTRSETDALDVRLTAPVAAFGPVLTLDGCHTLWRQRNASISRSRNQRNPLTNTLRRHRCFNETARQFGFAPIRLWRNPRFYRQLARRTMPSWMSAPFVSNPEGRR